MKRIDRTLYGFVRAHAVNAAHKDITKYSSVSGTKKQLGIDVEAGIGLNTTKI